MARGGWQGFVQTAVYKRKKAADAVSYFFDDMIQRTCQSALDGTLCGNADVLAGPNAIKELAKEPRFMRRALAAKMLEAIEKFPRQASSIYRTTNLMPSYDREKAYVFLQIHKNDVGDYENDYRPVRRHILEIACGVARNNNEKLKKVVGIAADAVTMGLRGPEDFILLDCSRWNDALQREYDEANKVHQFFSPRFTKFRNRTISEFPPAKKIRNARREHPPKTRDSQRLRPDKDALCSCGSGKPFSRCHKMWRT